MLITSKSSVGGKGAIDAGVLTDGEQPGRRNPIRWLVICGILLIVAIAIGTAVMIANFRDHALESSTRELENTVLLLARHFDQQLEDAEVPLDRPHRTNPSGRHRVPGRFQAPDVYCRHAPSVEGKG